FYLRLNRPDDAFDLASRASKAKPYDRAELILGRVQFARGVYDKAAFHLERAELTASVLEQMLQTQLARGRLGAAEQTLQRWDEGHKGIADRPDVKPLRDRVKGMMQRRAQYLAELKPPQERVAAWTEAVGCYLCAEQAHAEGRPERLVDDLL